MPALRRVPGPPAEVLERATCLIGHSRPSATPAPAERPTAAELQEAHHVLQQMRQSMPPILPPKGQPPNPKVVACAIALQRGEKFKNDRQALRLFGAHPETKVRDVWVDGYLSQFAPAGFNTSGDALPTYLLDREKPDASPSYPEYLEPQDVPSYVSMDFLHAQLGPFPQDMRDPDVSILWSETIGHVRSMAKRAREFNAWQRAHGAERDACFDDLAASEPVFYWALEHKRHSRPKWQLRNGNLLSEDQTKTIGMSEAFIEEPLLLYRDFRQFHGNVLRAQEILSRRSRSIADWAWLDSERAKLEPQPCDATRSSAPRCDDCGKSECMCPPLEEEACLEDPRGSFQAFVEAELAPSQRPRVSTTDDGSGFERDQERELARQGRIAVIHGRPWDTVPEGATIGSHWMDSASCPGDGGTVSRPWEYAERERQRQIEREQAERVERLAQSGVPPPHRDDSRYGPTAQNPAGDEAFRADRAVWYEQVTGQSLEGLSLTEQWEAVDVVARRFRHYSDGRPHKQANDMPRGAVPIWIRYGRDWELSTHEEIADVDGSCPRHPFSGNPEEAAAYFRDLKEDSSWDRAQLWLEKQLVSPGGPPEHDPWAGSYDCY